METYGFCVVVAVSCRSPRAALERVASQPGAGPRRPKPNQGERRTASTPTPLLLLRNLHQRHSPASILPTSPYTFQDVLMSRESLSTLAFALAQNARAYITQPRRMPSWIRGRWSPDWSRSSRMAQGVDGTSPQPRELRHSWTEWGCHSAVGPTGAFVPAHLHPLSHHSGVCIIYNKRNIVEAQATSADMMATGPTESKDRNCTQGCFSLSTFTALSFSLTSF